jgi:hypothetical protein
MKNEKKREKDRGEREKRTAEKRREKKNTVERHLLVRERALLRQLVCLGPLDGGSCEDTVKWERKSRTKRKK